MCVCVCVCVCVYIYIYIYACIIQSSKNEVEDNSVRTIKLISYEHVNLSDKELNVTSQSNNSFKKNKTQSL